MKYNLVACDLDGTLLDDNSNLTEKNIDAIKNITSLGAHFVVVTGRTYFEIPDAVRNLECIKYIIYSDGAVAVNNNSKEALFSEYFSNSLAAEIFNLLDEYDTMIELYENGYPVTDKKKINEKSYEYYAIDPNYRDVITQTRVGKDNLNEYVKNTEKTEIFNVFFKNLSERTECMRRLKDIDDIIFTTSMDNNIEIMPCNVSKGKALSRLCEMLNISWDKVITAGDSKNDISMFSASDVSVSPSNASGEIQRISDDTGCSNNEGIADYIYKKYFA
ncbi:MAG: HAD family hydrolase [Eubacteriales bacterium]|nr:HAD family hydrolase [Eubacteriales bacterium]